MEIAGSRILVCGATGLIGQRLVEKLVERGGRLVLLSRNPRSAGIIREGVDGRIIHLFPADLRCREELASLRGQRFDGVVHLSALLSPGGDFFTSARALIDTNIQATVNLLENLGEMRTFCFASSVAVYGPPRFLPVDEDHPTEPDSLYGMSKLAGEHFLRLFGRQRGIPVSILRISSVYGPQRYAPHLQRAIPNFIRAARRGEPLTVRGDGNHLRDYIFLDDVVAAIILSLEKEVDITCNISSNQGTSIAAVVEIIEALAGGEIAVAKVPGEREADFVYANTRAQERIGFQPQYAIAEGLQLCWEDQG